MFLLINDGLPSTSFDHHRPQQQIPTCGFAKATISHHTSLVCSSSSVAKNWWSAWHSGAFAKDVCPADSYSWFFAVLVGTRVIRGVVFLLMNLSIQHHGICMSCTKKNDVSICLDTKHIFTFMKSSVLLRLHSRTKIRPTWDEQMLVSFKLISQSYCDSAPSICHNQASTDSCGVQFQGHGEAVF